jgi:hypothetical protein
MLPLSHGERVGVRAPDACLWHEDAQELDNYLANLSTE